MNEAEGAWETDHSVSGGFRQEGPKREVLLRWDFKK